MPDPASLTPTPEFLAAAEALGVAFEEGDLHRLGVYMHALYAANAQFNLTAVRDPAEGWIKHVLDSLALLPLIAEAAERAASGAKPMRIADVGSGCGAPGLILACVLPEPDETRFTLIESTGKKARFLEEAARAIGLTNVEVECERAEVIGQDHRRFRERFDVALARAVGRIAVSAELTIPLLAVGGVALLTKGQKAEEEIEEAKPALHLLHASVAGVVETPTGRIVAIEKRRPTPRAYPRRSGEPARLPLGVERPGVPGIPGVPGVPGVRAGGDASSAD